MQPAAIGERVAPRRALPLRAVAACLAAVLLLLSGPARADDHPATAASPSAQDRRVAAKEFAAGQRAFKKGDYRQAADSFEAAYRHAPHPAPLWNAARSWDRAGDPARAANLYARYLDEAPPDSKDRDSATSALRELSKQLARLEIHAVELDDLRVDDKSLEGTVVYVAPGAHVIEGRKGAKVARKEQLAEAGAVTSVALIAAPDAPPPAPPPAPRGWSPLVVVAGAGVTAILAGFTVGSGVDTMSQRHAFDGAPTQANLDAGVGKEARTNALLGVTLAAAALTGAAAFFLVSFRQGEAPAQVGVGPGSVLVRSAF